MPETPRPPTILGEYGEGYCRVCHMIEPLDASGRIAHHFKGFSAHHDIGDYRCKGTGKVPPKLTPFASRLARFTRVAPLATCPVCREEVPLQPSSSRSGTMMARHFPPDSPGVLCAGYGREPAPPTVSLRHEGERG